MTDEVERVLYRDIAQPCERTATGDIATMAGVTNLQRAIGRRLAAMPGSVLHRPAYGAGLPEFLNQPGTPAKQQQLINRVKQHVIKERRVAEVLSVAIVAWEDSRIEITVKVRAIGSAHEFGFVIGGA